MPTLEELKELQTLPLWRKIAITQTRILEWYLKFKGQVYISFSGGKDSTVLLHIARRMYPDIEAIFCDTGLEYPEIRQFAKSFDNVTVMRPQMRFDEVIKQYGYPFIGKEVAERVYNARKCLSCGGGVLATLLSTHRRITRSKFSRYWALGVSLAKGTIFQNGNHYLIWISIFRTFAVTK